MSFLTPLYIAGLLAVSLPIVFHLIRRTPRDQFRFSSLMFLAPSPPRLTRRSRLDQVLLLLLRAAAIALLAFAFARPFLREAAQLTVGDSLGRRVAVLVDTSASMRRGDLWQQALAQVDAVLDGLAPTDEVAVFTFDDQVHPVMGFDDSREIEATRRVALARESLGEMVPSWAATDLGAALATVADLLEDAGDADRAAVETDRQIVLVSDLQRGSQLEALQSYDWPAGVQLELATVTSDQSTNASLQGIVDEEEQYADLADRRLRVRVTNDPDSVAEQFVLRWAGDVPRMGTRGNDRTEATTATDATTDGDTASGSDTETSGAAEKDDAELPNEADQPSPEPAEIRVYVPPGQSRVVRVPRPEGGDASDRLVLIGDEHDFDNTHYVVPAGQQTVEVVYVGTDAANDPEGLLFYLERAFPESPARKVEVVARSPEEPILDPAAELKPRLVVVGAAVAQDRIEELRRHVRDGGAALFVLEPGDPGAAAAALLGRDDLSVSEAATRDYAMLETIAFRDPLLAPFADPRFAGYTKIHFWKHRRVEFAADLDPVEVLIRFDNGDPALLGLRQDHGTVLVLTSGWHPADSEFAVSNLFVPLLTEVLDQHGGPASADVQYVVNDAVPVPAIEGEVRAVRRPDGSESILPAEAASFTETGEPGIYTWLGADPPMQFAINVAAAESRTAVLEADELEQRGARFGKGASPIESEETLRQMREVELEGRQKLWRWLIAATLGVLIAETWLAGRRGSQTAQESRMPT